MFRGKKYQESAKLIDRSVQYDPTEALELVVKGASAKFDETVELHIKLGVDSRHADQLNGFGELPSKNARVASVLGTFLAPISSLAFVLDQIREQKEGGAPATAEA